MKESQEPKYRAEGGHIHNRQTGEAIPDEEPIMIFRGKDRHAVLAIIHYASLLQDAEHREAVLERALDFTRFANQYPARMQEPTTTRKQLAEPEREAPEAASATDDLLRGHPFGETPEDLERIIEQLDLFEEKSAKVNFLIGDWMRKGNGGA